MLLSRKKRKQEKLSKKKPKKQASPSWMREDLGPGKAVLKPRKDVHRSSAKSGDSSRDDPEGALEIEEDNSFDPYNTTTFDRGALWKDSK